MKHEFLAGVALAAAFAATSGMARAQATGWYAVDKNGVAKGLPGAADDPNAGFSNNPEDWAGFAHVGYHLDPHWRVELQGGYKAGAVTPTSGPGGGVSLCAVPMAGPVCGARDRALGAYSAVANLIFDAMPQNRWVDPFVALGVGASRYDSNNAAAMNPAARWLQLNSGGGQLSYQALVGLAFRPHNRLRFDLSYRWMGAAGFAPISQAAAALGGRYQDQTVAISVRYALSSPQAAIPPAPAFGLFSGGSSAPRPARHTVVVETPSNPAALAAEAEAAVRQTNLSAAQGVSSHVVVDGHADTASTASYNARLSERRAKAMADSMVAQGVPAAAVDVRWGGEEEAFTPAVADKPLAAQTLASDR
jgi:opacity protein-like surface antigen